MAILFFVILLPVASSCDRNHVVSSSKSIIVKKAGIASDHSEASRVGIRIMKNGGNAADAAVAVAMALAVIYPQAGNIGGGGFLLYRQENGNISGLNFRETAPFKASRNMYLDSNGTPMADLSTIGALAVGVPGTVKGLYHFHQKFGQLSWDKILEPSIWLASKGFEVDSSLENAISTAAADLGKFPTSRDIFLPDGKPLATGERFLQTDLANTLKIIAKQGGNAFYQGKIAKEIVRSVRKHGGIISSEDLQNYEVREQKPVHTEYRQYSIYSVPPPSSGGIVLAGLFNSFQEIDFSDIPFHSSRHIAQLTELEKRYFALRNQYLGDPEFTEIPFSRLISRKTAKSILKEINIREPVSAAEISPQKILARETTETTHFSVVDSLGNAVSLTYTLNGIFGCHLVAGSTGILLNNQMDDFTVKAGLPNMYGLIQGEANSIQSGKRMLSSMSPVIVTKDNELVGLLGSPGGPKIITTVCQVLNNLIDYKMSLPQAMNAGRFHHQWLPDSIYYEANRFAESDIKELEQWGYNLVKRDRIGRVNAIWRNPKGWQICSDDRGSGSALGF